MPFSKEPLEQGDTPNLAEGDPRGFEFNWKFFRHPKKLCWGRLCNEAEDKKFMACAFQKSRGEGVDQRLWALKFEVSLNQMLAVDGGGSC